MKTTLKIVLALLALMTASTAALAQPQPQAQPQDEQFNAKAFFEQQNQWGP